MGKVEINHSGSSHLSIGDRTEKEEWESIVSKTSFPISFQVAGF